MPFESIRRDVGLAGRMLRRNPTYALTATLTLALGLAAATAVFAVVDGTLLRPLPFTKPDRLVSLFSLSPGPDGTETQYVLTEVEIVRWRGATSTLEGVEAVQPRSFAVTGAGEPQVISGAAITAGLFPMLGVPAHRGRSFTPEEERGHVPVAVVGYGVWQRLFEGSPSAIGKSITIDGASYQIIGVMPASFHPLLDASELWIPLDPRAEPTRVNRVTAALARLRDVATPAQAEAELRPLHARVVSDFPNGHSRTRPQVVPLRDQLLGARRPALIAVAGGVALLILLACANVANLTLGHLARRRTELTVRTLLGASRWDMVQQQLTEALVVSIAGGSLGLGLTVWSLPALIALQHASNTGATVDVRIDWRVLLFFAAAVVSTGIISGIIPALRWHATGAAGGIGRLASTRIGAGRSEQRVRRMLVMLQVALACLLLCSAGALLLSLERLLNASPGFQPEDVLTMQMMLPPARYPDIGSRARFVEQMLERVSALPGVTGAGTTQTTFMPNESMQTRLFVDGRPVDPEHADSSHIRHVTPGYFRSLQVPILEGRAVDARDRLGAAPVCMVSAEFAKQFWPHASALGHRVRRPSASADWMTIVGVAGDVMDTGAGQKVEPTLYVPYLQANTPTARITLVVRTHGDPLAVAGVVRAAIWSVDPARPVDRTSRLSDLLAASASDQRFRTVLLTTFAVAGLLLSLIGVYGVTASAVEARRWETGVRLALGARPALLVWRMVAETAKSVAVGTLVGLLMFFAFARLLAGLLYQTSVTDARVLTTTISVIVVAALVVAFSQARRLADISPSVALRDGTA